MGLFTKKPDPIVSQEKALDQQIAALELEIRQLNRKLSKPTAPAPAPVPEPERPPVRSANLTSAPAANRPPPPREPIFESVESLPPVSGADQAGAHFNELGVRKYDVRGAWQRMVSYLRGPSTHNPKLVSYLAAGSIRGLRPLRYEKRVARNRTIMMAIFLLAILYWLMALYWKHR